FLSIRCKFEDRIAAVVRHKETARAVKNHVNRAVKPSGEGALHSFWCEFEDRVARVFFHKDRHKEIALVVKSQATRVSKPGGEGVLLRLRREFEDRSADMVRHKKIAGAIKSQVPSFRASPEANVLLSPSGVNLRMALPSHTKRLPERSKARFSGASLEANVLLFPSDV